MQESLQIPFPHLFSNSVRKASSFKNPIGKQDEKNIELQKEVERRGMLVQDLIHRIEVLMRERQSMPKQAPQNDRSIAKLEGRNQGLLFKFQEQELENKQIKKDLDAARRELTLLKVDHEEAQIQIQTLQNENLLLKEHHSEDQESFKVELERFREKNAELEMERQLLDEENQDLHHQLKEESLIQENQNAVIQQTQQSLQLIEEERDLLQSKLEERKLEIEELELAILKSKETEKALSRAQALQKEFQQQHSLNLELQQTIEEENQNLKKQLALSSAAQKQFRFMLLETRKTLENFQV